MTLSLVSPVVAVAPRVHPVVWMVRMSGRPGYGRRQRLLQALCGRW